MPDNDQTRIDHPGRAGRDEAEEGFSGAAGSRRVPPQDAEEADGGGPAGQTPDRDADEGGDLLSHFVRRTDNSYAGITDKSLLGEDIGDDEVDEDGEPI